MTVMLTICVGCVLARVGPVGFAVGFAPALFLVFGLGWTGRFDRLLPAGAATVVAGLWPLYRWLALGDVKAAKVYLVLAGFINGMLLLIMAMEFAKRRGWIVESPLRRRLITGAILVNFASTITHWPTGVWRTGLFAAWFTVFLLALFCPARGRKMAPTSS